jgi:hypothetical protein
MIVFLMLYNYNFISETQFWLMGNTVCETYATYHKTTYYSKQIYNNGYNITEYWKKIQNFYFYFAFHCFILSMSFLLSLEFVIFRKYSLNFSICYTSKSQTNADCVHSYYKIVWNSLRFKPRIICQIIKPLNLNNVFLAIHSIFTPIEYY